MGVRGIGGRRAAAVLATIFMFVVTFLAAALAPPASAATPGVTLDARVNGNRVGDSTETRPIRLSPKKSALLVVEVTNNSTRPIDVRIVRLEGKVVGLTFFAYDTAVAMTVAPGAKGSRRFPLDLGGLDGQATGLLRGSVKLLDPNRHVVAEETGVIDVRGSLLSVYGLFGVGIAVLTIVSLLGVLVGLARHRLPPNRWRRALRFMTSGIVLGLLVNFTLSATRVFVPGVGRWLTIVVVSAAVFFGLGSLTPDPSLEEEEEKGEEEEEEALALPASPVAPALEPAPAAPELAASDVAPEVAALDVAPEFAPPDVEPEMDLALPQPELEPAQDALAPPSPDEAADEAQEVDQADAPAAPSPPLAPVEPVGPPAGWLPIVVPCYLPSEDGAASGEMPAGTPAPAPPTVVVPPAEP